ncbi:MAG: hypothetical protein VX619_06820 [bacterium]|nr:hypothetical protein [bacterium]
MTLKKFLYLGITFLIIVSLKLFGQAYAQSPSDYKKYAEILLINQGIEPAKHSVLISNCSYILNNFIKLKEISKLEKMTKPEIQKFLFTNNFWAQKLHREIIIPYSDVEFRLFISNLQLELNGFVKYLNTLNSSSSEFELKIFGSMAKARFGMNSSLDILIHSSDKEFLSKLDNGIYSENNPKFRGNINLITSNNESYFLLDPYHTVTTGELSNLAKIYQDILESNNLKVKQNTKSFNIAFTSLPPKLNLEFNAIEDRMFFLLDKLKKLENTIENSTEIFVPSDHNNQTKTRQYFLDQMHNMSSNLEKVKNDLKLIIEQVNSPRHKKIKTIIEPASYSRLEGYRGRRMLALIDEKLILIEKKSQALK